VEITLWWETSVKVKKLNDYHVVLPSGIGGTVSSKKDDTIWNGTGVIVQGILWFYSFMKIQFITKVL